MIARHDCYANHGFINPVLFSEMNNLTVKPTYAFKRLFKALFFYSSQNNHYQVCNREPTTAYRDPCRGYETEENL